jgi:hypothetical protein
MSPYPRSRRLGMGAPWRPAAASRRAPTDVIRASPERVWELLTNPERLGWLTVRVVEAPARNLEVGDRLVFGPAPGLRLSWNVLSVEPLRTLELDIKVPFGITNHEIVVMSPLVGNEGCRVTFT